MSKEFFRIPAPVDLHDHLRDMGQNEKETFGSGTRAALAGGIVLVDDKPNKLKPILALEDLIGEIEVAKSQIVCDVGFDFGSDGKNLDEFPRIKKLTNKLKVFLNETTGHLKLDNPPVLLPKIYKAWPEDGLIFLHAEDDMIPLALKVIEETRRKTHFHHISTKRDLMPIILAKKRGLSVTCGVTPHHLFLSDDDVKKLGTFGYMKPELASQADVDFLWEYLDGIDVVETDHAPYTISDKLAGIPGVPGLETMLSLMLTAVLQGRLSMNRLIELISTNPQKILGIKLPESTYTLIDLGKKYKLSNKGLETKCGWTPFVGKKVQGKVKAVYIRGEKVFDNGNILAKAGSGQIIFSGNVK